MQGRALIDLRHGDYLKVVVPPGRGELRKYYTREVAQCMRRGYRASNIPVILEANPEGIDVTDMPVYDTFAYVPKPADLDYDKDAMALFQMPGHHVPPMDPWPSFSYQIVRGAHRGVHFQPQGWRARSTRGTLL